MRKELNNGTYLVEVKEDEEGLGIIIDVFNAKTEELINTYTYWNTDLE